MSDNKALWNRVCKTDPRHVKPITGKQYSGNSPKPYWIVERLTDEFGPCGIGWGFTILSERMERLTPTDVLHVAVVRLWFLKDGQRGEFEQIGQTKAVYAKKDGTLLVDEDAPKKSVTDALVKCASYLGFAGDIFSGRWDDSKYVNDLKREFAEKDKPAAVTPIKRGGVVSDVLQESPALPQEDQDWLLEFSFEVSRAFTDRGAPAAFDLIESKALDDLQKIFLWNNLASDVRSAIKKHSIQVNTKKAAA
jgi:hypothetical protein